MSPIQKIQCRLAGNYGLGELLNDSEQSVLTMLCHLEAIYISEMPTKAERSMAVSKLPDTVSDAVKQEIVQLFELRKK